METTATTRQRRSGPSRPKVYFANAEKPSRLITELVPEGAWANPSGQRPPIITDATLATCLYCDEKCDPETELRHECGAGPYCRTACQEMDEESHSIVCSEELSPADSGYAPTSDECLAFFFSDGNLDLADEEPSEFDASLPQPREINILHWLSVRDGIPVLPQRFKAGNGLRSTELNSGDTAKTRHYLRILHYGWLRRHRKKNLKLNRELLCLWKEGMGWPYIDEAGLEQPEHVDSRDFRVVHDYFLNFPHLLARRDDERQSDLQELKLATLIMSPRMTTNLSIFHTRHWALSLLDRARWLRLEKVIIVSQEFVDQHIGLWNRFEDYRKRRQVAIALGEKEEPKDWDPEDGKVVVGLGKYCFKYVSDVQGLMNRLNFNSLNYTESLFTQVCIPSTPSTLQLEWPCVFPRYLGFPWTARPDLASQNYTIRNDRTLHNHHGKWLAAHWLKDPRKPGCQMLDLECHNMGHCVVYSDDEHLALHPIWMFFVRVFVNETILDMAEDNQPHRKYVHYPVGDSIIDWQDEMLVGDMHVRLPVKKKTHGVIGFEINAADLQVALTLPSFLLSCEVLYFERYRKQFGWSDEEQATLDATLVSLMAYAETKRATEVRAKALARPKWHQRIYRHRPVGDEVDFLDV